MLPAVLSTILGLLVSLQVRVEEWLPFAIAGGTVTGVLVLVCSRFIRLSLLSPDHASRAEPVEMTQRVR